jgi:predicted HicB family RNase H-like nuclease
MAPAQEANQVTNKSKPPSGQFRLRLPRSMHGRLAALAYNEGVSMNHLITDMLALQLGAWESEQKRRAALAAEKATP